MPDSGFYVITTGLSLIAFLVGLGIGLKRRRGAVAAYVILLGVLLFKAILNHNPAWEYALFPHRDYIYFQSYLLYPIALTCLGLAIGLLPRGRNRNAVVVLTAFCFVVSLWMERWMLIAPDASSQRRAGGDHHCAQSTPYSCGPAACVSLLSYYGIDTTEGVMMALCRTPPNGGTSLFRIWRGLLLRTDANPRQLRIVDGSPEELRRLGVPAIVSDGRLHVVVARFDEDKVVLHDPARERPRVMSFEQYRRTYDGPAVVIAPPSGERLAAETGFRSRPR